MLARLRLAAGAGPAKSAAWLQAPARWRSDKGHNEALTNVDYDYVSRIVDNKKTLIVDVREPDELKEQGQIPSAINVPLGSVTSTLGAMSEEEFEKTYRRKKPTPTTEIIFYCQIGKRSQLAQLDAIQLGYNNVKNYLGSYKDWCSKKS